MNKFEKESFKKLSDKEKEEVAGGTTLDESVSLTDEQCNKLRIAIKKHDEIPGFFRVLNKYGGPQMTNPAMNMEKNVLESIKNEPVKKDTK